MPPFGGDARRVVLDQLGSRRRRIFADVWEFVRFAKEQNLDLDFITPPQKWSTVSSAVFFCWRPAAAPSTLISTSPLVRSGRSTPRRPPRRRPYFGEDLYS
ncbi:MAG TPA: hypothetical protein VMS17_27035 [Gemmataceae bacterium]|nr:hypothetical protein [Gemmataceae bacterium]